MTGADRDCQLASPHGVNLVGHPGAVTDVELWLARHGETEWSRPAGTPADRHPAERERPRRRPGVGHQAGRRALRPGAHQPAGSGRATPAELAGFGDAGRGRPRPARVGLRRLRGRHARSEIRETRPGWTVFDDGCPGGETLAQVAARADRVIDRVRGRSSGRAICSSATGTACGCSAARWVELPPQDGARLLLGTATVSVLGWERETPAISQLELRADVQLLGDSVSWRAHRVAPEPAGWRRRQQRRPVLERAGHRLGRSITTTSSPSWRKPTSPSSPSCS